MGSILVFVGVRWIRWVVYYGRSTVGGVVG